MLSTLVQEAAQILTDDQLAQTIKIAHASQGIAAEHKSTLVRTEA